jgi:hypothetical protein
VLQRLSEGQSMILIPDEGNNLQAISYLNQLTASTGRKYSIEKSSLGLSVIQPDLKKPFFGKIIQANSMGDNVKTWSSSIAWSLPKSKNSIMFTTKGLSYLEKCQVAKGRLFLFSSNVLEAKNSFMSHGLFLPIFQELVLQNSYSAKLNLEYNKEGFQVFPKKYFQTGNLENQLVKLKYGNEEFVPEQEWIGDHWNCKLPSSSETGEALNGIFTIFSGNEKLGLLAINFPKMESDIKTYSLQELQSHYFNLPNVKVIGISEAFLLESHELETWSTSRFFLLFALILFLIEMGLLYFYATKV